MTPRLPVGAELRMNDGEVWLIAAVEPDPDAQYAGRAQATACRVVPGISSVRAMEELRIQRGEVALAGSYSPARDTAVVALHGASEGKRDSSLYSHLHKLLPPAGIGVVTFDRRGEGESTGGRRAAASSSRSRMRWRCSTRSTRRGSASGGSARAAGSGCSRRRRRPTWRSWCSSPRPALRPPSR
jgi:hypothetical protein